MFISPYLKQPYRLVRSLLYKDLTDRTSKDNGIVAAAAGNINGQENRSGKQQNLGCSPDTRLGDVMPRLQGLPT